MTQEEEFKIDSALVQVESMQVTEAMAQKITVSELFFTFRPMLISLTKKWWIGVKVKRTITALVTVLDVYFGIKG